MPLSLLDCAHWQQRVYDSQAAKQFDRFWDETPECPWALGIKRISPTIKLLAVRGSITRQDWIEDFRSQVGIEDGNLGVIPQGFADGLYGAVDWVGKFLPEGPMVPFKTVIVGHSLGAAHAVLLAGLLIAQDKRVNPAHKRVDGLVLFGCPRPGQNRLKELIGEIPFVRSFVNRQDPVPEVPLDIPMIEPWVHPCWMTKLDVAPAAGDHTILADHHIDLYTQGMTLVNETLMP